jgi:ASC-1-like (ASCH) protein
MQTYDTNPGSRLDQVRKLSNRIQSYLSLSFTLIKNGLDDLDLTRIHQMERELNNFIKFYSKYTNKKYHCVNHENQHKSV